MPVYAVIHLIIPDGPPDESPRRYYASSDEEDEEWKEFKEMHVKVLFLADIKDYEHRRSADGFYEWFSWVCQSDEVALAAD
ncbi:Protein of unknown function [Pyronema omphalodes CBS 100304]|uniref:Uncharacterized protein n=1 Tax=Pyronema omphalodes (strain CBS 100304) TaxID=1076935 RepID=U4L0T8_PYROM|nr:Protein of unknown function [Pyronema omphalodes CBS 100304]